MWLTCLGYTPLEVVLAHVGGLIPDGLLRSLHRVAQLRATALELLQELHQDAALLLPARRGRNEKLTQVSADVGVS